MGTIFNHKNKERGGAEMEVLFWFVMIIAGLWLLWYFGGGPDRAAQEGNKPFIEPLNLDSDPVYYGPTNH